MPKTVARGSAPGFRQRSRHRPQSRHQRCGNPSRKPPRSYHTANRASEIKHNNHMPKTVTRRSATSVRHQFRQGLLSRHPRCDNPSRKPPRSHHTAERSSEIPQTTAKIPGPQKAESRYRHLTADHENPFRPAGSCGPQTNAPGDGFLHK